MHKILVGVKFAMLFKRTVHEVANLWLQTGKSFVIQVLQHWNRYTKCWNSRIIKQRFNENSNITPKPFVVIHFALWLSCKSSLWKTRTVLFMSHAANNDHFCICALCSCVYVYVSVCVPTKSAHRCASACLPPVPHSCIDVCACVRIWVRY